MSEWVAESDWSKVAVGDRVRVERAEFSSEGTALKFHGELWLGPVTLWNYQRGGWTLYVASKPTPALPTEPGIYVCVGGSEWEQVPLFLYPGGRWVFAAGGDAAETAEGWHTRIGLVRLESQADTAQKVLDAIGADPKMSQLGTYWHSLIAEIVERQFGVSL